MDTKLQKTNKQPDTRDHAAVLIAESLVEIHKCIRWQANVILTATILISIMIIALVTN